MIFTGTPTLYFISKLLAGRKPDWERVSERYRNSQNHHNHRGLTKSTKTLGELAGLLAEIHIRNEVEDICIDQGFYNVEFDPINDKRIEEYTKRMKQQRKAAFNFHHDTDGRVFAQKGGGVSEADISLLINDQLRYTRSLPVETLKGKKQKRVFVVIESSIGKNEAFGQRAKSKKQKYGLEYGLGMKHIARITRPGREVLRTPYTGAIYVIPKDQVRTDTPNPAHIFPESQASFERRGGFIVPFYTDRISYQTEIRDLWSIFDLKKPKTIFVMNNGISTPQPLSVLKPA